MKGTKKFNTPSGGVSAHGRKQAKAKGHTLPGTDKFPINNLQDLKNAKHDIGRTSEPRAKVVAYIDRRAKELGGKPVGADKMTHGGDRRSMDHHLNRAGMHIQKALEKRLAQRDKK